MSREDPRIQQTSDELQPCASKNQGPWETPMVLSSLVQNTFIEELL